MTFRALTPVKEMFAAVVAPWHLRFGQFGDVQFHDWKEQGRIGVKFTDGYEEFGDDTGELHLLLRPCEIVDPNHPKHSTIARFATRESSDELSQLWIEYEDGSRELMKMDQVWGISLAEIPQLIQKHLWLGKPPRETIQPARR